MRKIINLIKAYTFAEVVAKGLNWSLLLILPQFLSIEDYGFIALLISLENILLPLFLSGQNTAILRFYSRFLVNEDKFFNSVISVWLRYLVISFPIVILAVFLYFKNYAFVTIVLCVPLIAFREIYLHLYRAQGNTSSYLKLRLPFQFVRFILTITFSFILAEKYWAYPIAISVASLVGLFQIIKLKTEKGSVKFSYTKLLNKPLVKFGTPLIFHAISTNLLMYFDRYMIEYFMTTEDVGIYTLAYSYSFSLFFVTYIAGIIFQPIIYQAKKASEKSEKLLNVYTNCVFVLIAFAGIILWFVYPHLIQSYPISYKESIEAYYLLLLSMLMLPFYHQGNFRITMLNKTTLLPISSVFAGLVNILLNFYFIPAWGLKGAAFATLIANISLVLITNFLSTKRLAVIRNKASFISLLALSALLVYLPSTMYNYIAFGIILVILVALLEIYLVKFKSISVKA